MADEYSYDGDAFDESHAVAGEAGAAGSWDLPESSPAAVASETAEPTQATTDEAAPFTSVHDDTPANVDLLPEPVVSLPSSSAPAPVKSPHASRLPVPVSRPTTIAAPAPPAEAADDLSPLADSPRKTALLAANPSLARANRQLDALRIKGAQVAAEHDGRVNGRTSERTHVIGVGVSAGASDAAVIGAHAAEVVDRMKRERDAARTRAVALQRQVDELRSSLESASSRARKAARADPNRLDSQALANALKRVEIFRRANDALKTQLSSALNPEAYGALLNRAASHEAHAGSLAEENKTLKGEVRRLTKELQAAAAAAGDAPSRLAAGLDEIKHLRDRLNKASIAADEADRRARRQQEQVVSGEERVRRAQAQIAELERKLKESNHQHRLLSNDTAAAADTAPTTAFDAPSPPTRPAPTIATGTSTRSKRRSRAVASAGPSGAATPAATAPLPSAVAVPPIGHDDLDAREKLAEARLAEGIRSVGGTARRPGPLAAAGATATRKKNAPPQLGKIDAPTPPTVPQSRPSAVKPPSRGANPPILAQIERRASAGSNSALVAAVTAAAPQEEKDSTTPAPAPVPAPAPTAAQAPAGFDVDEFLGLKKAPVATTEDPYAARTKHKTNAEVEAEAAPAAVASVPDDDATPAWLRAGSVATKAPEESKTNVSVAPTVIAAAPDDGTPAWLKSASTTPVVAAAKPQVDAPAPVPAVEIGGRRARGPKAVAAAEAAAAAPVAVPAPAEAKPAPQPVADDTPAWLRADAASKTADVPAWLKSSGSGKAEATVAPAPAPAAAAGEDEYGDEYGDDFDI